jgi:putative membrane protein
MSDADKPAAGASARRPRVFRLDDPALVAPEPPAPEPAAAPAEHESAPPPSLAARRGPRWGSLLTAALVSLFLLASGLWFARFVSVALARDDWVGWLAIGLAATALLAAAMIVLRELVGLLRLARLADLRRDVDRLLASPDREAERDALARFKGLYAHRPDLAWALARVGEHERDIREPGELLALADREVLAPLDAIARRLVLASAKRVSMVTALSPLLLIAVAYVAAENVRLLRNLAGLYGGRPGNIGAMRLLGLVLRNMIAAGGIALTDDLLGQFLGQDLLRRVSRRLGEGAFNGALTARIGATAIQVTRPLPYIEASPVRARDILAELFRRQPGTAGASDPASAR